MDCDISIGNKDCFYDEDFLDDFTKDFHLSSLLDITDASPSEILADAAPVLIPPFSPVLSVKSSPTESSNSDSGSEDDSKNSNSTPERQSSQSPFEWWTFDDELPNNLNIEDVEQFLQKTVPVPPVVQNVDKEIKTERNGPVMAIENGVIKGIALDCNRNKQKLVNSHTACDKGNGFLQNSYYKVVNEHSPVVIKEEVKPVVKQKVQLVVEQKKVPCILKRPNALPNKPLNIVVPAESTKGGSITISPLPQGNNNCAKTNNPCHIQLSPPKSNIVLNSNTAKSTSTIVQNGVMSEARVDNPASPTLDLTHLSDAEIRAFKKQQRMIKNRESACQSRQKKKEYVTALEQQLLEAHQEIANLRLENKLLRDQLDSGGRGRKIPRLDTSILIPKKNIAVIFAMVFMVSLNFNILGWNSKPFINPSTSHRSTRHLLWSEDSAENMVSDYDQSLNSSSFTRGCQNMTKAPDYVNQTESIRIAGELNRWIGGGKTLNWTYDAPRKKRSLYEEKYQGDIHYPYKLFNKLNIFSNIVDLPSSQRKTAKEKSRLRRVKRNKDLEFPENDVYDYNTLYPKPIRNPVDDFDISDLGEWNALLEALHRRDDTFYIVGVGKGEHLLLPAVYHNTTRPPKMALILPAKLGNDSIMNDHVTLMQIDCAVVNTTLVKLKSDALPGSVRKKPSNETNKTDGISDTFGPRSIHDNSLQNSSKVVNKFPIKFEADTPTDKDSFPNYIVAKYEESKKGTKKVKRPTKKSKTKV